VAYTMPANILAKFINTNRIGDYSEFAKRLDKIESLKEQWDKEIEEKKSEVNSLKKRLDGFKTAVNFIGIDRGFEDLSRKKEAEANVLFWSLIAIGSIIILPLAYEIYAIFTGKMVVEFLAINHAAIILPIISLEVILVYFFRIILLNHKSAKAQIMQIDLRRALCKFIQEYSNYSIKIKEKDSNALEKFENLIFSGILADPGKLPSTFDGMDQLGNLLKKAKSP
jgi:hypothetical protein